MGAAGDRPARLDPGRARTGEEGDCADAPGSGCLAGDRGGDRLAVVSRPAGRGVRKGGPDRRGPYRADRSTDGGGQNWGASLRGGAVSAEGAAPFERGMQNAELV